MQGYFPLGLTTGKGSNSVRSWKINFFFTHFHVGLLSFIDLVHCGREKRSNPVKKLITLSHAGLFPFSQTVILIFGQQQRREVIL